MNAPRDHHFIPAFYLKQWTGLDGKLVEYSRKGGKLIVKPVAARQKTHGLPSYGRGGTFVRTTRA